VIVGVAVCIVARRDLPAAGFFLQAALPWGMTLAISTWGERPLLQDRYLAFAIVPVIALWGWVWAQLPHWVLCVVGAMLVGSFCLPGAINRLSVMPDQGPPITQAVAWLVANHEEGDLVLTSSPAALNLVKYHAFQAGRMHIDVRCPVGLFPGAGQQVHTASLSGEDVLREGELLADVRRIWVAGNSALLPDGLELREHRSFQAVGSSESYGVALYIRSR
jgi:hypothetical protein